MNPASLALRVLIVDDEALARARLAQLVSELSVAADPPVVLVGEVADASAALAWLGDHEADLLLLDVQMPGMAGTELAARLQAMPQPPSVVFVSAHSHHALRAFELEAVDYLTKPVRRERLQEALGRVARRLADAKAKGLGGPVVVVSERGRLLRVPLSDVLYLRAELKYVTLRTARRSYVLDDALSDLEQRLGERFLRVHRNAVVARAAIAALEKRASQDDADEGGDAWAVRVEPTGEWLTVSRRQVGSVREALATSGL